MDEKTILYVEDNYHNRRIVRKILTTRGYNVVEAEDGLVGYEMICEMKPPLVLLDIALPHLDGIQIVQRLKADKETRHIPVVALTASAMRGDRERFLEAGCDDYLSKPVRAFELVEMVERYCQPPNGEGKAAMVAEPITNEGLDIEREKVGGHTDIIENGHTKELEEMEPDAAVEEPDAVKATPPVGVGKPVEAEPQAISPPEETPPAKGKKAPAKKKSSAVKKKTTKSSKKASKKTPTQKAAAKKAAPKKSAKAAAKPKATAQKAHQKKAAAKKAAPKKAAKVAAKPKATTKKAHLKRAAVKKTAPKKVAKEAVAESIINKTIAEMFSSLVVQPPSPDEALPEVDAVQPALEESVAEMLAEIPAPPPTPDTPPVSDLPGRDTTPVPIVEESTPAIAEEVIAATPKPAAEEAEADPAPVEPGAVSETIVGGAIWVIDSNPTDSRLMRRLLAAKLNVEVVEIAPQDAASYPDSLPALLIFGAKRPNQQLRENLSLVRSREGMTGIPYVILTMLSIDSGALEEIAPDVEMVWLKEQLIHNDFLSQIGELLTKGNSPSEPVPAPAPKVDLDGDPRATVLVIEDISDSAALAQKILKNNNFNPLIAESGEQGLTIAKEDRPDLILLDLGLPDVDGQTLIGILRADPELKDTPVILCTAWPKDTLEKMVDAYGFDGYISKPYKVAEFMQVIEANTP